MTNYTPRQRSTALVSIQTNFSPFGTKLIQAGYADTAQMQQALKQSREQNKPLIKVLEEITGKELPPELLRQYKKLQLFELKILYGVPAFDPEMDGISVEQIGNLIETLNLKDTCRLHRLLPLSQEQGEPPTVVVAMVDPDNINALDDLKRILQRQGMDFKKRVMTLEDYQQLFSEYLDQQVKQKTAAQQQQPKVLDLDFSPDAFDEGEGEIEDTAVDEDMNLDAALTGEENSAPVISIVNKILARALSDGVSDIHVEPQEEHLQIRMRKDGVLFEPFPRLPKKVIPAITSRFKIIANLDIAERRQAQDGRIRRIFQGRAVDFRVNCLPSRYGEKIVLRILDNSSTQLGLDKLITDPETLAQVREIASRPFGLFLVTGPTGSGKSTSLYSILAERNDPGINICTAEDPIEYALPGITQVQVIRAKGLDFANILRAFLRQDPDVILVGETRDRETAKTAIEAALTGHLVLTTLHTNDAAGAIARLDEMGVEPFMVSGALLGVLAQRLMRRVCTECRIAYTPTPEELGRYAMSASQAVNVTFYKPNVIPPAERKAAEESGNLCPKCRGVGYKGRVGVYEFLRMSERIGALINQGAPTERIKEAAVEEGMKTLLAYSLQLVREGYTTFEEVDRVTFTDAGLEAELKAKRKQGLTCKVCFAELQPEMLDCPYCMTPRFQD
ncbi:MAG: GspE/PulE family protein [Oscillatoriaceae bacterium SKW80]|nr:GspE/PulE family protein [Oscillatoriaceae bacterium SKYG93]MCX8119690.1 GspE/PulE family protein [Oscillatoriaceae bacterium SKW80]MDW8452433.1 GspE/PulE family protein [Oscillatoriaceae cyanobacterium SKYGB_i_bin93]HIK27593.1 type II/IV secretion system protein [Oscillatoriaceae cyanobacterium M7585_C2015_266]